MTEQVAVIVGGASGIGWATAQTLAAQSIRVTIADRNTDLARERAATLGDPHAWAEVEVTDEARWQRFSTASWSVKAACTWW